LRQLKSLLAERDQVIGELTIANRILGHLEKLALYPLAR
jgi:hypothetical protein